MDKITNEEWENTFNSISDFIFILDINNIIIKVNKSFLEFTKIKIEDIIGKKCHSLLHKLPSTWHTCPFEKTKLLKKSVTEEVDDPTIGIPLLVTTSPIFNEKGEITGCVHIEKDISEMKETKNELKKKIAELEKFNRLAIGRELKMVELKKRIKELESKIQV